MAAGVTLETFLGNWRDSMGHYVQVDWAKSNKFGGQLDVALQKPKGYSDPIRLNVKRHPDGRFSCGHYDLDTRESRTDYIVWVDHRKGNRKSIWERDAGQTRGDNNHRNGWESNSWNSDKRGGDEDRRWSGHGDYAQRGREGDRGYRDAGGDGKWRDSGTGDAQRGDDSSWGTGRDAGPFSDVNSIPVKTFAKSAPQAPPIMTPPPMPPGAGSQDGEQQQWSLGGEAPRPPPPSSLQFPPANQQPGPASGLSGLDELFAERPSRGGAGHPAAERARGRPRESSPPPPSAASPGNLWGGGATPGAWVPPTGPPPSGEAAAANSGSSRPAEDSQAASWHALIEGMYRRHCPEKLEELPRVLEQHRGRESELYHAMREKYDQFGGPAAMHPGMHSPWGWPVHPHMWPHPPPGWPGAPPAWPPPHGVPPGAQVPPGAAPTPQWPGQPAPGFPPPPGYGEPVDPRRPPAASPAFGGPPATPLAAGAGEAAAARPPSSPSSPSSSRSRSRSRSVAVDPRRRGQR